MAPRYAHLFDGIVNSGGKLLSSPKSTQISTHQSSQFAILSNHDYQAILKRTANNFGVFSVDQRSALYKRKHTRTPYKDIIIQKGR